MKFLKKINNNSQLTNLIKEQKKELERQTMMIGRMLSIKVGSKKKIGALNEVEFKVFSQFGDDGIIQWLIHHLDVPNKTFIEFGVEDYRESNTRFLMMNDNWSGFVMDASPTNISKIKNEEYFWRHELYAKNVFITAENVNQHITSIPFDKEIGLLHIDLDGNDYWIWKAIECISPIIVIIEYNSVFGKERTITIPYKEDFVRSKAHHSNLYAGASLAALYRLSKAKGYKFIGCNGAGNNAYFVRKDKINDVVKEVSIEEGFMNSKFRESRDQTGKLTYLSGKERYNVIKGMPIYNTETGKLEKL